MRTKITKAFLYIAAGLLTCAVLLALGLQTPFIKKKISDSLASNLAELTSSNVKVETYEGFVPLNFNLYGITFAQKNKIWLKIDRLHLNYTLLKLVFFKNKGVDIKVVGVRVLEKPLSLQYDRTKDEPFALKWPVIPYRNLSVNLKIEDLSLTSDVTEKKLPIINAKSSLNFHNNARRLNCFISLSSPEIKGSELELFLKGNKKHDKISGYIDLKDSKEQLNNYLFEKNIPTIEGRVTFEGSVESFNAFFDSSIKSSETFDGDLKIIALPHLEKQNELAADILGNNPLDINGRFKFDPSIGFTFDNVDIFHKNVSLVGLARINRNNEFVQTHFKAKIPDVKIFKSLFKHPIEGSLNSSVDIKGPLKDPTAFIELSSEEIIYGKNEMENVLSNIEIKKNNQDYSGYFSLQTKLNNQPSFIKSNFSSLKFDPFTFEDLRLNYGRNRLQSPVLKVEKSNFQGTVNFQLDTLSNFSPMFQKEIYGDLSGTVILDVDISKEGLVQRINLEAVSKSFQYPGLSLTGSTISVKGKMQTDDFESFEGNIFIEDDQLSWKKHQLTDVKTLFWIKEKVVNFKVESSGELSLSSAGSLQKYSDTYSLLIRSLQGYIHEKQYRLTSPITIAKDPSGYTTSPLNMRGNNGFLNIDFNREKDTLAITAAKFPIDIFTFFYPSFDATGYLNMNADIIKVTHDLSGELEANLYQVHFREVYQNIFYHTEIDAKIESSKMKGAFSFFRSGNEKGEGEFELPIQYTQELFPIALNLKKDAKVDFTYKGTINPFMQMFIPYNHLLEGKVSLNLLMEGPLKHPHLDGLISIENGYYENLSLGLILNNIDAQISAEKDLLILRKFNATDDLDGQITGNGNFIWNIDKKMPYQFTAQIELARVIQFDFLTGIFQGGLEISGNMDKAKLIGEVNAVQGEITIPNRSKNPLPILNVKYVYDRADNDCLTTAKKNTYPIEFDIDINIPGNTYIRGRGLDSSWRGKVKLVGTDIQPELQGRIENVEGVFGFAGRTLKLNEGVITFNGDPISKTHLDIFASIDISSVLVKANLKGPLNDLRLQFKSNPPHPDSEIISLILYNETVKRLTPFQAVALTNTLAQLSGVYTGPDVIDKLRKGIGLDQLTFGSGLQDGDMVTIQIGKYIARNILITLNRPISAGSAPIVMTAHFPKGFQIQTSFDDYILSKISLQWKLNY